LYQQDIPKAEEDSDEEGATLATNQPKKRWRARNPKEVGRQWVLQEQVEFLETMMAKRQKRADATSGNDIEDHNTSSHNDTSSRYEGVAEHNQSQYILLETPSLNDPAMQIENDDGDDVPHVQVTMLPVNATVNFSQPRATHTLSMSEAESAIEKQRGGVTRFMMHGQAPTENRTRSRLLNKFNPEKDVIDPKTGKKKSKRQRLLDGDLEDEDDVMGDLAFRNRKGSAKARKELLSSFGDDGMKVDADGVLGGANDGMFGTRGQKFGRFQADQSGDDNQVQGADDDKGAPSGATTGNDGLAMADDFYKRDVQAEYEELDYDANEQFDDDDVDVGETEVMIEDSAFDDVENEEDIDDELGGERLTGAEGLASLAGFRLLLAKARGEITPEQAQEMAAKNKQLAQEADKREAESDKNADADSGDYVAKIIQSAESARIKAESKQTPAEAIAAKPKFTGKEVDENGQRLITTEAVHREIWLNDGKIPMKRLMKIFDVKKKSSQDRQVRFKDAVRELCTMENDPVSGRMLVLKQHYRRANM
jgi:hypothetical protein